MERAGNSEDAKRAMTLLTSLQDNAQVGLPGSDPQVTATAALAHAVLAVANEVSQLRTDIRRPG